MVVFPHSSLPLTSNLKLSSEESEKAGHESDQEVSFNSLLETLIRAIRKGHPPQEDVSWDYKFDSLWSPLLRGPHGRINIWKCTKEAFVGLLRSRTYWYKRLPLSGRLTVKKLAGDSKGRRKLKDVLDTSDGVLTSLLFSFPEMFRAEGGYTLSDRIINSVIMNCFHDYSGFQKKLKKLRKTVRCHFLNKSEPLDLDWEGMRFMSYMIMPCKLFRANMHMTSKSWMFRLAMFTQTRATGLAGRKQVSDAIDEFLQSSQERKEYSPNGLMCKVIEEITDELSSEINLGKSAQFRISMSTSACRESPRRTEGKFGYLKSLIRDGGHTVPQLGEESKGFLGDWLWPEAIARLASDRDDDVKKVNIAAIRENGKARIVTSGSFWKETALQPFSHITINLIKTLKNLRSGLGAGRLGWRFISKIGYTEGDTDGFNWIFERKNKLYLYTTDWSRATDGPSPEMGRHVVGTLLRKTGLDPETLETILDYWVGQKAMYYKGKYVGTLTRGIPMGDPLTKTNLSLAHPICHRYAVYKTGALSYEEGNGDDTVAITDDPAYAKAHAEAAEQLGYERSPDDDVISKVWGTYSEEYFCLPVSRVHTVKWGSKFKNSLLLPYLDTPKLRVMIATTKDREDFSSNSTGKVTLLGHDAEYISRNDPGPLSTVYSLASAIQDISLATIDDKIPLFLPRQVNGVGKPPPFWSSISWKNIFSRCRPWHRKYYLRVMYEYNNSVGGISGYRGALKESNHFQKEMMVELYSIPDGDAVKKHLAVKSDVCPLYPPGVLSKLVTLGYLIPESKIARYYLMNQRLQGLNQDLKQDLFETVKLKMVSYPDLTSDEEERVVDEFCKNYRDQPFRLKQDRVEDLYFDDCIKELEDSSPLSVTNSGYPLIEKFKSRPAIDSEYQRQGLRLYEWFRGAHLMRSRGREDLIDEPPTDILEDDPIIISNILGKSADVYIIVSDDLRLFRLALNKFPDKVIMRMPVISYIQTHKWLKEEGNLEENIDTSEMSLEDTFRCFGEDHLLDGGDPCVSDYKYEKELENLFSEFYSAPLTVITLLDRGNIESYENRYNDDGSGALYQTMGIHWTSQIKAENLEKKPYHGFFKGFINKSWRDLSYPRHLGSERDIRVLSNRARKIRSLARGS